MINDTAGRNDAARRTANVLLVEDDAQLADTIRGGLAPVYSVSHVETLGKARGRLSRDAFDLLILDLNLPDGSGFDLADELRRDESDLPILMLTARAGVDDRVQGFQHGADDYVCKPFAIEELAARLDALQRRYRSGHKHLLTYRDVQLDLIRRTVRRGDYHAALSDREAELLAYFMRHPQEVLHRDDLVQNVWGDATEEASNVINVYVNYLRNKLERFGRSRLIHTVRGVGYMLSDREPDELL